MQESPTYSICCHTRDFEYINDFIEHHLNLGFDKIVIYDNMSITPVKYDHPKVEIISWDKPIVGFSTYNDYLSKCAKGEQDWTAFIDEDEFINTKGKSIQEVMIQFKDFDSLGINWRMFGDTIDENNFSKKLKDKYLYYIPKEHEKNTHIKTFCKNASVIKFTHPHFPIFKRKKYNRDVEGSIIKQAWSKKTNWDIIWIDHYHLRGLDNYLMRKSWWVDILGIAKKEDIIIAYEAHKKMAKEKRIL